MEIQKPDNAPLLDKASTASTLPTPQKSSQSTTASNAAIGILAYLASTVFYGSSDLFQKFVFSGNSEITFLQALFIRQTLGTILISIFISCNPREVLWDFPREHRTTLIMRTLVASLNIPFLLYGVQNLNLTIVGLINGTVPVITAVLSAFVLSESISCFQSIALLLSMAGLVVFIIGGHQASEDDEGIKLLAMLSVIMSAFFTALTNVQLRQLRSINFMTVPFYSNALSAIVYFIMLQFTPHSIDIPGMTQMIWIFFAITATTALLATLSKQLAYKFESAAKLSIFQYSNIIVLGVFDFAFFDPHYNLTQIIGMVILAIGILSVVPGMLKKRNT